MVPLYTECRRWRKERRKLIRKLGKQGISRQTRPEKGWLASLLANEQAVGPLLKFLRSAGIGSMEGAAKRELQRGSCKEGAAKKELEWGRRNGEEGEDLLSD